MNIAIAGAGIGGLVAALACARHGHQVTIVERAAQLEEAGAGIQLTPNALNVLYALGLGPALERSMVAVEAVNIRDSRTARLIQSVPVARCREKWGTDYGVIHRADLQSVLLAAVAAHPAIRLACGHEVNGFTQDEAGVTLTFATGQQNLSADLLIGADGLWSAIRTGLGRSEAPRFSGKRAWRAVIPMEKAPELFNGKVTGLWLGQSAHLVHYPVRAGAAVNLVAVVQDSDSRSGWSTPQAVAALLPHYKGWSHHVTALLASVPEWRSWPLFELSPGASLASGRVALIGDAAHPMLPFMAQGGACAIEDAAELANALADQGLPPQTIPARLQAWSARRVPRIVKLQAEARANGERYHWNRPLSSMRDLGLKVVGGTRMLERYEWVYGWQPAVLYKPTIAHKGA